MKFTDEQLDLDSIDFQILGLLQEHCKMPFAKIGEKVGLSAPAVMERIKKLEDFGVITGYTVTVDARRLGQDITAFIGVSITHPKAIPVFERDIDSRAEVLDCHHVTGSYTLLLKAKTLNTSTLEELISHIRSIDGVGRTETMVVLSTHTERPHVVLKQEQISPIADHRSPVTGPEQPAARRRGRRNGEKIVLQGKTAS
jgi:Lrp/AsnC family transcriptional regulator, leucine-responsive regulatory protein